MSIIEEEVETKIQTNIMNEVIHAESSVTSITHNKACNHCSKTFLHERALKRHIRVHAEKKFKCNICPKMFLNKYKLSRHMLVHTGEKPYSCTIPGCTWKFSLLYNLHSHMQKHKDERPYKCNLPTCARAFARVGNLKAHLKTHAAAIILAAQMEEEQTLNGTCPK